MTISVDSIAIPIQHVNTARQLAAAFPQHLPMVAFVGRNGCLICEEVPVWSTSPEHHYWSLWADLRHELAGLVADTGRTDAAGFLTFADQVCGDLAEAYGIDQATA